MSNERAITEDIKVIEMAKCIEFAINNFKNKPILNEDGTMQTWHAWFLKSLKDAGFIVKDVK